MLRLPKQPKYCLIELKQKFSLSNFLFFFFFFLLLLSICCGCLRVFCSNILKHDANTVLLFAGSKSHN